LVLETIKVAFAMENKQLSQQRPDGESRRLEYKSPTLHKIGKLSDVTLSVTAGTDNDGMANKIKPSV
jgi:hypothetical protein